MEVNYKGCRILLVEDEETLGVGLVFNLEEEGYNITWIRNGREAVEHFEEGKFDMIILDIMLPYLNGYEVAGKIRQIDIKIPILMLTARTEPADKVKGFEAGADDYITKPFHLQELLLRVKGMLKRKSWYSDSTAVDNLFIFGNNEINFDNLICKNGVEEIRITPHEAMVLKYLIERKGEIVTRKELLENVWHLSPDLETRTVDIFISRLRKYFELNPAEPKYFKSIRGAGYMFIDK